VAAKHPDFEHIQRRLRRINPTWYPPGLALDTEYGPGMARGLDAALDVLEEAHGLTPYAPPAAAPVPAGKASGKLPAKFRFLLEDPVAPLMVRLAIGELGLVETPGSGNNSVIIEWADEVARTVTTPYAKWAADWYNADSIPWCGLFMAVIAVRASQGKAERMPPTKYLSALEWATFGEQVSIDAAAVGDVMVLGRKGGGHVTLNVGTEEGGRRFFGLGANQGDAVNIAAFDNSRLVAVRRPAYSTRPAGARRVIVGPGGPSSTNEG
jgi:uncharacterized protein (TIGR02594 family)